MTIILGTRIFLIFSALCFLSISVNSFIDPAAAVLTGMEWLSPSISGKNEIRANYGGMHGALGLLIFITAFNPKYHTSNLYLLVFFIGGLLIGRGTSILIDGLPNATTMSFTYFEIASLSLSLLTLYLQKNKTTQDLKQGEKQWSL